MVPMSAVMPLNGPSHPAIFAEPRAGVFSTDPIKPSGRPFLR